MHQSVKQKILFVFFTKIKNHVYTKKSCIHQKIVYTSKNRVYIKKSCIHQKIMYTSKEHVYTKKSCICLDGFGFSCIACWFSTSFYPCQAPSSRIYGSYIKGHVLPLGAEVCFKKCSVWKLVNFYTSKYYSFLVYTVHDFLVYTWFFSVYMISNCNVITLCLLGS